MLHLFCGKIAAGKSTRARQLAAAAKGLLVTEDEWMSRLFPGEVKSLGDYVKLSGRLKDALGPHVVALLEAGLTVVMDFPANTLSQRGWLKGLAVSARAQHVLHFLDVDDGECKRRLAQRNASGTHPYTVSEQHFDEFTRHFVAPGPDEGLNVVLA